MTASSGRLLYEIIFWAIVGVLVYLNRGLYQTAENIISPVAQAYTPVVLFLLGVILFLIVNYLREAIAATAVSIAQSMSGDKPLDFDKGNPGSNIQKSARRLERKGNFQAAGEAYESLELWAAAAQVYERGNLNSRAASAWEHAHNNAKAIEYYEKDGNYEAAGNLCQKEGLPDRAARNYRIAGDHCLALNQFSSAAEFYERAGDFTRAGTVFEQAQKQDRALFCYEKAGDTEKILELIKQIPVVEYHRRGPSFTGLVQRSAEVLFQHGHAQRAAQVMEECHDFTRAAEIYSSCQMWDKSAELYLKVDNRVMAERTIAKIEKPEVASELLARLAVSKGDWSEAGRNFEAAGKQSQAIDAYKKSRDFESAARIFEAMGRFIMAGEMYSSSRNFTAAANAYAKAYDWRNAAECFEESGDLPQAVEAYANAGNYLKAGALALKITDYARAVEFLQRIPPGAPDFTVGTAFLATAFYHQHHHDMAHELFSRVMDELTISRDTLPAFYSYAAHLEPDDPKKSLRLYRQILGIDIHYADVSDHVHRLEQIVTSMSTGYGKTPVPTATPQGRDSGAFPAQGNVSPTYKTVETMVERPAFSEAAAGASGAAAHSSSAHGSKSATNVHGSSAVLDNRYQLQTQLSQYGRVTDHLATDTLTGQQVIIRTFPPPREKHAYESTKNLISAVSQLSHQNITKLVASGEADGLMYTVTPVTEGQTLRQWIRTKGPVSIPDMRQLAGQLLEILSYAHSHEVCHLNLRPEVVFVNANPERRLILTGFGAPVRQPVESESMYMTMPDSDPQFLAPEQIIGADVDSRTDIYAFGLLFFFMLTGRTPFEVKRVNDTQEIARMQVQVSLPRPSTIRATLPSSIDEVFMKCVSKSALARYQSASDLLNDVQNIQTNPVV